jgi:manganese transport system permease protein
VVITLQAVGIILVVAMLIIPGATAYLLTASMGRMLVLASVATSVAALAGVYVSYYADVSTGGAVVVAQAALFLAAYLFGARGGVLPRLARRRRAARSRLDEEKPAPLASEEDRNEAIHARS